jgi:hypothetical protein
MPGSMLLRGGKWIAITAATLLGIVLLLIAASLIQAHFARDALIRTEQAIEADLRQNLPDGTDYQRADEYLTAKGIGHSYYAPENRIYALIPNIGRDGLFEAGLQIIVDFDDHRRVKSLVIKRYFDAL